MECKTVEIPNHKDYTHVSEVTDVTDATSQQSIWFQQ